MGNLIWKRKDRLEDGAISHRETVVSSKQGTIYVHPNRLQNFFGPVITVCLLYSLFLNSSVYYDFSCPWCTAVCWGYEGER